MRIGKHFVLAIMQVGLVADETASPNSDLLVTDWVWRPSCIKMNTMDNASLPNHHHGASRQDKPPMQEVTTRRP